MLLIYVGNLFLGAFLFHAAECPGELEDMVEQEKQDKQDIYINRYLGNKGTMNIAKFTWIFNRGSVATTPA